MIATRGKLLAEFRNVVMNYHMAYALTRTSMALDKGTLAALRELARKWGVSQAEVMRRAVKRAKEEVEREEKIPKPIEALDWLQAGGGLSVQEAEQFRAEVQAEREARQYWWEQP